MVDVVLDQRRDHILNLDDDDGISIIVVNEFFTMVIFS